MLLLFLLDILSSGCLGQFSDGDARLFGGKVDEGIVQLYKDGEWKTVCGLNYQDKEAGVHCRHLGFRDGKRLPSAAYGEYPDIVAYPGVLQRCSTGQEVRLTDCVFDVNAECNPTSFTYAAAKCFDVLQAPTETVKLENGNTSDSGYFSRIMVHRFGTWGQVCGEFWADEDAAVTCRQLGYKGGRASFFDRTQNVPFLVGDIQCHGNETSMGECVEKEEFCYEDRVAGVFCYKTEAPRFSLVGGKAHYGKVVLRVDGVDGLLCKTGLTYLTAEVVCKEMGYHSGYDMAYFQAPSVTTVILQDVDCTGEERSFWECSNSGWGNVTGSCQNADNGFSVYCYSKVRLFSVVEETEDRFAGRVELWDEQWRAVCAEIFTQDLADLVCSEFGLPIAQILVPDAYGRRQSTTNVNSILCTGREGSLSQCNYTLGGCQNHVEQANLLCRHENFTSEDKITVTSRSYHGRVTLEHYGLTGTICRRGWDDNDASVACKILGFNYGVSLGTSSLFARYTPVWKADIDCHGNETDLNQCGFSDVGGTDWGCSADFVPAGVLCSNSQPPDPPVRLKDGISDDRGRVEVYHEQTGWGTVCDTDWSVSDADVFCRQLGFAEGQVHSVDPCPEGCSAQESKQGVYKCCLPSKNLREDGLNAYRGTAQGSVLLSGVNCDGSETSLLQCPSAGWLRISSACDHSRDAGAFCYKHVILKPSAFYGAILIHKGEYKLVCADDFDQTAADVVCRELGFIYSNNLCCSAMGPQNYEIGVSEVHCTGNEKSLTSCEHNEVNPSCPSGSYAAVVCSTYEGPFQGLEILDDGRVRVNYFINDGFICTEDFSENDAKVVCRAGGFSHGYGIKVSAQGNEHSIRWLRDMQCHGNETTITDCDNIRWGEIGVCDWTAVAGVICTQDPDCSQNAGTLHSVNSPRTLNKAFWKNTTMYEHAGLEFDVRLANGTETSGRVEVKINNEWGTVCGNDFTKNEAVVICGQLGYFDGVNLAAGLYGGGTGEVSLNGVTCSGREKSLKDCIWSGYKKTSGLCDHTKDAAVKCYYNIRLTGSTTVNYGRFEVYNNEDSDWLAVCDYGLNVNEANVLCRMLGYHTGLFQNGSPLGPTDQPITISEIDCNSQSTCTFKRGSCRSGKYVALYCSESLITTEGLKVRLPLGSYYGLVEISRFGLWGAICDLDFDDNDAQVICKQLNFKSGYALSTYATDGFPTIQGHVNCGGNEASLANCNRGNFAQEHGCYDRDTVAGVLCFNDDGVHFSKTETDPQTGLMETRLEIETAGNKLYVALDGFTDVDASVYCLTLGFAGGKVYRTGTGSYGVMRMTCKGEETSIFQCPAVWDPQKTQGREGGLAGVSCFKAVSLLGGNSLNHGILYSVLDFKYGPVCAEGFDKTDAGVACKNLGFDAGLVLCCSVYGTADDIPVMTRVQCNGDEQKFTDCRHSNITASEVSACQVNYAAVACYSGDKSSDYSLSLPTAGTYNGVVILRYLDIDGRICSDGWDNRDADVVCKELGFFRGFAQINQREDVRLPVANGPYWTSNINCSGTETRLRDCDKTEFGMVTSCESRHYAGVICYDREGLFYRLAGSDEARYGRVEVSIQGEFRSICDLYWGNTEAHVLCRMLGFRAGEAYHGSYKDTGGGPVWDANFQCSGREPALNECPSTSWEIATSPECAVHQNDAGAFCYTSVKLSTGVGRVTDRGGVLLYWNDRWNTICSDDFNDTSARVVCQELGFMDGRAQCCSAYGVLLEYGHVVTHKVKCKGDEVDVTGCLVEEVCQTQQYASVICYGFLLTTEEITPATIKEKEFDATPIIIAVVLFVALVIIALIIAYCVLKRRKQLKLEKSKEQFDNRIVSEARDSSIIVRNPMHELGTPEISRVKYTNTVGEEEATITPAYSNPAYSRRTAETAGSQEPVDVSGVQPVVEQKPVKTGNYQTVISVNPHLHERLPNSSMKNPYDNNTDFDKQNRSIESNPYSSIRTSKMDTGHDYSTMVERLHVSSPQASVQEPKWPQPDQNT